MSDATPPYPSARRAWTVVLILFATAVLAYTDRQVLSLLVDPIRHDLHVGDTGMSLLLGLAFAMVYGVAGLPLGVLADRMSRRNLIAGGVVWLIGVLQTRTHSPSLSMTPMVGLCALGAVLVLVMNRTGAAAGGSPDGARPAT